MEINFLVNQAADNSLWIEIGLVAFGAVLGFLLSILTTMVTKAMDKRGKLQFYYQLIQPTGLFAIRKDSFFIHLQVPVWFEFQNTSNTTRVIRDVCLYLYKGNQVVVRLVQVQYIENVKEHGRDATEKTIQEFGGEKNSYSFVLPPTSIQKQECNFAYVTVLQEQEKFNFDEIRVGYYDEKDAFWEAHLCDVPDGWECKELDYSREQKLLKFKKTRKRNVTSTT